MAIYCGIFAQGMKSEVSKDPELYTDQQTSDNIITQIAVAAHQLVNRNLCQVVASKQQHKEVFPVDQCNNR
jgi:hypothetical protein